MPSIDAINSVNPVVNQQDGASAASNVINAIRNAASQTGVSFSYLMQKASQESGMDSTAKSGSSSAAGLFQFTSQTWLQMVKDHGAQYGLSSQASQITADSTGRLHVADPVARHAILALRNDPQTSAEMAGELDKQNAAVLKQNVGGKIGGTELYLAHFLGAGGASDFLSTLHSSPTTTAASVLPDAAAANQSIFYSKSGQPRSVAEIYQHFAQKFDSKNPSATATTQVASATSTSTHAPHYAARAAAVAAEAEATQAASTAASYTMASSLPTSIANFTPVSSLQSSPVLAANSGINISTATKATDSTTRAALASSSTLFNTMVLGQLQNMGANVHSPLGALNDFDHSRKANAYATASVA